MAYTDYSLKDFVSSLASKTPTPGGGGASALASSLGAALGVMVGNYTVGKKKYAEAEPEIKEIMEKMSIISSDLLTLVDSDAEAFLTLSDAYAMPDSNPEKATVMEDCLKKAADVPLNILKLSCTAVQMLSILADKGSTVIISDAATGAAICRGAILGAAMNVRVNTKLMKDRHCACKIDNEVDELVEMYVPMADEAFERVYRRYL